MAHPTLSFEVWKRFLESDCEWHRKLPELSCLEDQVLRLFWERGAEPTVKAIVNDGLDGSQPKGPSDFRRYPPVA